jgi:hypothetical protein
MVASLDGSLMSAVERVCAIIEGVKDLPDVASIHGLTLIWVEKAFLKTVNFRTLVNNLYSCFTDARSDASKASSSAMTRWSAGQNVPLGSLVAQLTPLRMFDQMLFDAFPLDLPLYALPDFFPNAWHVADPT